MLVLTRKPLEAICIDDDVTITVVEVKGDKVKLAIEAPRERTVHRAEIWQRIQDERAA